MAQKNYWSKLRVPYKTKNLSIAKKALRKVNKLARRVRPEQKIHDIGKTSIAPTIAGIVTSFIAIAQGDTEITRDGLQIRGFFFEFRWTLYKHGTPTSTAVRLLIVRDNRQVESTSPSVLDVLLSATPEAQYSRVNPKRFTILYNRLIMLNTNRPSTKGVITKKISFPIRYVGAANSTITRNGIYMIAESNAAAAEEPTFTYTFRLRFTDV